MAVKFSQFDGTIAPIKTSETQFIVGFEGTTNAKWTMKALADEIGGGDNIYIIDGILTGNRTVNQDGNQLSWDMGAGSQTFTTSSSSGTWMNLRVGGGQKGCLLAVGGGGGMYFRDSGGGDYYNLSQNGFYLNRNAGFGIQPQASQRLTIKGEGVTSSTTSLAIQDSGGADIFNVTDDGEVKIESNQSNYTGFRIKAANGTSGINQTAYISDNYSGGTLQDIKPFLAKRATSGATNRDALFLGPASSTNVGYNNAGHTIVNGPWQGGAPSFNTAAGYFAPMITSSMFIAGGGNETGLFIGSGGQDSSHYALQVRSDNAHLNGSVWFQLRGDDRIVYTDGNEAVGKVLTCDANGVATWQTGGGSSIYTADGTIGATAGNDIRTVTIGGTSQATANHIVIQPPNPANWGTKIGPLIVRGSGNDVAGFGVYSSHAQISGYGIKFMVDANYSDLGKTLGTAGTINQQGKWTINGDMGLGRTYSTGVKLYVQGDGATSNTRSLLLENNNGNYMMSVKDDGQITIGNGATIQSTSNPQYSVVIGYGAKDKATAGSAPESVAIGRIAVGNSGSVAIGGIAKALGSSSVAVGAAAEAAATGTSVGYQAGGASAGSSAVSIGKFAQAKATGSIAIGANTGLTGANSIVLNATTGVTSTTTTDTFEVFMSDASAPDFKIAHDGNSYITGTGNFGFGDGNTSPTATVDIDGTFRLRSATNVNGKVLTADANGNGTWQTASTTGGYSPTISIENTNGGDVDLYDDNIVRLWLDDSTSDDIELEITNYNSSTSSTYHVNYTNFEGGGSSARTTTVDLNEDGATSISTLDFNFTDDECMKLRIWSPRLGLGVGGAGSGFPFYEITIVKSGTLYTGAPIITSVLKSTS